MEMLLVDSRSRSHHHQGKAELGSRPSRKLRGANCRAYHSAVTAGGSFSPLPPSAAVFKHPKRLPSPPFDVPLNSPHRSRSATPAMLLAGTNNGSGIATSPPKGVSFAEDCVGCVRSELWAGPAFSNSPPPSSLPIPKFSLRQKRSDSLELPPTEPNEAALSLVKSAPSSPTNKSRSTSHFLDTAIATEDLRRILHLDICDE